MSFIFRLLFASSAMLIGVAVFMGSVAAVILLLVAGTAAGILEMQEYEREYTGG